MRIDDTTPPAATTDSSDADTDTTKSDDQTDEASPFARVLAKKQEGRQEGSATKGGVGGKKEDPASFAAMQIPADLSPRVQPEAITAKHAVELPPQLQQLVHEISVVAGKHQVHIEMNSNVLKGLQINIENQNGAIAIQFLTNSPAITTLLTNNLSLLSKGLDVRGVNVSDIRIDNSDSSKSSYSGGQQSGGRSSGGSQGGKR
jgi:flagellar hook-length control protein FliK